MDKKGASGIAVAAVLIIVVIIVVALYGLNSGVFKLNSSSPSKTSSSFTISAVLNASHIYSGQSAPLYLTFFNPYNQSLNTQLTVAVSSPSYISIAPSSKTLIIPADMTTSSSILFNVSCSSSNAQSGYLFSAEISNVWQNITTSLITYPYNIKSTLIPSAIQSNNGQGFMLLTASPESVETQIPSGSLSSTISLVITPDYNNGDSYTHIAQGTPNDFVKSISISISNSTGGVASAFVYYNGQNYPFTGSGKDLYLSMSDVNLGLIPAGLPIEITATNDNSTSQNIINININYNYYFSFTGTPSEISCT